jgi:Rod binding domain-containing protein
MQQMRATAEVPGAAIPASTAQDLMQGMFEGEVARTLSRRADCGLARLLFRHLEEQLQAPTDSSLEQPVPLDREPAWFSFQKETPEQPARSIGEPTWYALPKEEAPGIELPPQAER